MINGPKEVFSLLSHYEPEIYRVVATYGGQSSVLDMMDMGDVIYMLGCTIRRDCFRKIHVFSTMTYIRNILERF